MTRCLYKLPLRLRSLFRTVRVEQELSDELRFHLEELIEQNITKGMALQEARYAALRELGGVDQIKEECRDMRRMNFIEDLIQDVRYGLRQLRRNPGFTAVAVIILAFGLAAVITIFAVVDAVMLRPLDFPHSERLFTVTQNLAPFVSGPTVVSIGEFQQWDKPGLFKHAAAIGTAAYTLLGRGHARRLFGTSVTPDFFRVFGVRPLLGRGFVAQDAMPGHDNVIVLSLALWKSAFGGDPHIVGKAVRLSDAVVTVIGVMPPSFDFPRLADVRTIMHWAPANPDFWIPLIISQKLVEEGNFNYFVVGRLKDKVTPARAAAQFTAVAAQLFRQEVAKEPAYRKVLEQVLANFAVYVTPLRDTISSGVRRTLWLLLAAVGVLLLLVLFNLGNLVLTRSVSRLREFAVREAFGASLWRIFRQGVVEQMVLIAAAAGLSLVLADWGIAAIRSLGAGRLPRLYDLSMDMRVVVLLSAISVIAGIAFGSLPLLLHRGSPLRAALQTEGRSTTADLRTNRLKSGLMVLEIAVSLVLLLGACLLIQSFVKVIRVNPGFDPHNLLTVEVALNPKTNQTSKQRLEHVSELLRALRNIPGVMSAAVVNHIPLTGEVEIRNVGPIGKTTSAILEAEGAEYRVVDSSYFKTMRIPILAGRNFRDAEAGNVAVIDREMALRLWPGENAIGKDFRQGDNPPLTVIGVVGAVHNGSLEQPPDMQFYEPLASDPYAGDFMIRTRIKPEVILPLVEKTVGRLDPEAPVGHAQTMQQLLRSATLDRRLETTMVGGFAAAALFLAAFGLFSVASFSVARRTREFGIRLALGASGGELVRLELSRTLKVVAIGLGCGLAASLVSGRLLAGFLFDVTAWSPTAYALSALALIAPALLAAWLPARHASRVEPTVALRYE